MAQQLLCGSPEQGTWVRGWGTIGQLGAEHCGGDADVGLLFQEHSLGGPSQSPCSSPLGLPGLLLSLPAEHPPLPSQVFILEELLSPIVTPLILIFCLRPKSLEIIDFFRNFTVEVVGVGDTCSFAQMDVRQHGHPAVGPACSMASAGAFPSPSPCTWGVLPVAGTEAWADITHGVLPSSL